MKVHNENDNEISPSKAQKNLSSFNKGRAELKAEKLQDGRCG
jgi:hypothetical protein